MTERVVNVAAVGAWLDEQICCEQAEAEAATENMTDDDQAFYEGMVAAYKVVRREWVEGR